MRGGEKEEKKKVLEGCLCISYSCEGLLLLDENSAKEYRELRKKLRSKTLTEEEKDECDRRLWEIERKGQWIDEVLGDLEGKKVRITVEVVEGDVFNDGS